MPLIKDGSVWICFWPASAESGHGTNLLLRGSLTVFAAAAIPDVVAGSRIQVPVLRALVVAGPAPDPLTCGVHAADMVGARADAAAPAALPGRRTVLVDFAGLGTDEAGELLEKDAGADGASDCCPARHLDFAL